MEEYNRFVPDVHFEKIPIKNLVSNQKYQRIDDNEGESPDFDV